MSHGNNSNKQQHLLEFRQDDKQNKPKSGLSREPEPDDKNQQAEDKSDPQQQQENIKQAEKFSQYIKENGIGQSFQIIFAEILSKKIKEDTIFAYTAMRLRQIGNDVAQIKEKQNKK